MINPLAALSDHEALALAYKYLSSGQPAETVNICTALLRKNASHVDALCMLSIAHFGLGQESEGKKYLRKATALAPALADCGYMDALLRQQEKFSPAQSALVRYREYKKLQATDAFIISYPKCGRTWLRLLLGKFLQLHFGFEENARMLELHALSSKLPGLTSVDITHDDYPHWKPASEIERSKRRYKGKKVVFLARDPRDVLVSYYFQYVRRGDKIEANDWGFNGTVSDFIRHRIGGVDNISTFYNVWADQRHVPAAFFLLRYEDLHAEPAATLRKLLEFLDFPKVDDAVLERVIAYGSFDNMKRIERENSLKSNRLASPNVIDPESFKVRKGKVAGYGEYLTAEDIEFLDRKLAVLDDLFASYKRPAKGPPGERQQ
ncbi:MAG: sulfotransferase domain-containing protein [Xanthobacteraceae bacterium]